MSLNIERMDILIAHLQKLPARNFNMGLWLEIIDPAIINDSGTLTIEQARHTNMCGTAGCIAGWAAVLFGEPRFFFDEDGYLQQQMPDDRTRGIAVDDYAQGLLGMSDSQAQIFYKTDLAKADLIERLHDMRDNPDESDYFTCEDDDSDDDD